MKINMKSITALKRALEKSTLTTYDIRIEECDEYLIRFEDLSFRTVSIYFPYDVKTGDFDECIVGWMDQDGKYHFWSSHLGLTDRSHDQFLIDLTCSLMELHHHE